MLQILSKIPIFALPLLIILLLGGLRARKTNTMPLALLLLIPSIFFVWGLFTYFSKYGHDPISIFLWFLCLATGFLIGFTHMQKMQLRFDKKNRKVEMPGSWIPLMLSMSIFTSKLSIGMLGSLVPHFSALAFLGLELFATTILGIFAGRGIGCLFRYRATSEAISSE